MHGTMQTLYDMGCRNFMIAGVPPLGCKPLQITEKLRLDRKCVEDENRDAELYNRKLMWFLRGVQAILPGTKIVYADMDILPLLIWSITHKIMVRTKFFRSLFTFFKKFVLNMVHVLW